MKPSIFIGGGAAALTVLLSSGASAAALSAAEVQRLGAGTTHPVIVIMKNQLQGYSAAFAEQSSVMSELSQVRARNF
jgi:uncharacterized membrane protein